MSLPSLTSGSSVASIHQSQSPSHGFGHGYHDYTRYPHGQDYGHSHDYGYGHGHDNQTIRYPCVFSILNCFQTFTNAEYWKTHVLSHFRTFEPPAIARCSICPSPASASASPSSPSPGSSPRSSPASESEAGPEPQPQPEPEPEPEPQLQPATFVNTPHSRAWDALLDHMISHYQSPSQPSSRHRQRTDFELLRYLYTLRLITEDQWKAAVQLGVVPGSPTDQRGEQSVRQRVGSADEPFWGVFSPRRERGRMDRERIDRERERNRPGPVGRVEDRIVLSC